MELYTELKKLLPEFTFNEYEGKKQSIYATRPSEAKTVRSGKDKSLIRIGGIRSVFVSSVFPKNGSEKAFRYVIIFTKSRQRGYRCKRFVDFEYNKFFYSANTDLKLLKILKAAKERGEF